ncbi:MAG: hypothetical protein L3J41_07560 [Melioribacteraceae bacterium]|nr:hypothetical protein [Melioribacteraceae bacterium]
MKINKGYNMKSIIIILLLLSNLIYSQKNTFKEKIFSIDINTIYDKTNRNVKYYLQNDFAIDNNNIYLTNKDELGIIKFDKTGRRIFTKNLVNDLHSINLENIVNYSSLDLDIETDANSNLYCLIKSNEYFIGFLKYDSNGIIQEKYALKGKTPSNRIISYYINHSTSEIIFNTMPIDITNPELFNIGRIFIYNLEGVFLRRSKYYVHDSDNNSYKADYKEDGFEVTKIYEKIELQDEKETKKIKIPYKNIVKEKWQRSNADSWYFVGVGKNEILYYANNEQIAKFNFSENTIKYIKLKNIIGNNLYTSSRNMRTTPNGELLIKAFSENIFGYASKKEPTRIKTNSNEIELTFIKIN